MSYLYLAKFKILNPNYVSYKLLNNSSFRTQKQTIENTFKDVSESVLLHSRKFSEATSQLQELPNDQTVKQALDSVEMGVRIGNDIFNFISHHTSDFVTLSQMNLVDGASLYTNYVSFYSAASPILGI